MDIDDIRPDAVTVGDEAVPLFSEEETYEEVTDGVYIRERRGLDTITDTDWLAIEEETTMCAYGATRMDATYAIGHAVGRYRGESPHTSRGGAVVEQDGTAHVEGTRVEVTTIYRAAQRYESLATVAGLYELRLTEVVTALEWVNNNRAVFDEMLRDERLYDEWVSEYWNEKTWGYERPDDLEVTFDEFKQKREE